MELEPLYLRIIGDQASAVAALKEVSAQAKEMASSVGQSFANAAKSETTQRKAAETAAKKIEQDRKRAEKEDAKSRLSAENEIYRWHMEMQKRKAASEDKDYRDQQKRDLAEYRDYQANEKRKQNELKRLQDKGQREFAKDAEREYRDQQKRDLAEYRDYQANQKRKTREAARLAADEKKQRESLEDLFDRSYAKRLKERENEAKKAAKEKFNFEQQQAQAAINFDYRQRQKAERDRIAAARKAIRDEQKAKVEDARDMEGRRQGRVQSAGIAAGVLGGMGIVIGGGVKAMVEASIDEYVKFNQAMTQSTSIMGKLSSDTVKHMERQALSLSTTGIQGPEVLARSYYYLASAGYSTQQIIKALPIVQNFATAGMMDMAKATSLAADSQASLGMKSQDATQNMINLTRIVDVLAKADNVANASIEQFATSLSRQGGAALKMYNKDVEEGVAVLAAMADQGIKAEYAGTQLSILLRYLGKTAIKEADAHKYYGLQVFNTSGQMRNLGDIIGNMEEILGPMNDQTRAATLLSMGFEARMQQAILPLLGTSEAIKKYEKELRNAGGTTKEVAEKQLQSFSNQMTMIRNQIKVAAIELGGELAPAFLLVGEGVSAAVAYFRSLDPAVKVSIVAFGLLTAAFLTMSAAVVAGFVAINVVSGGVLLWAGAITVALAALSVGAAAAGTGLIQYFGGWSKVLENSKTAFKQFMESVDPIVKELTPLFMSSMKATGDAALQVWRLLSSYLADAGRGLLMILGLYDRFSAASKRTWSENAHDIRMWLIDATYFINNFDKTANLIFTNLTLSFREMIGNWRQDIAFFLSIQALFNPAAELISTAFEQINKTWDRDSQALKDKIFKLTHEMGQGLTEYRNERLKETSKNLESGDYLVTNEAKRNAWRQGEDFADEFNKGMHHGLTKIDAAAFGSAEAITRIEQYRYMLSQERLGGFALKPGGVNPRLELSKIYGGKYKASMFDLYGRAIELEKEGFTSASQQEVRAGYSIPQIQTQQVANSFSNDIYRRIAETGGGLAGGVGTETNELLKKIEKNTAKPAINVEEGAGL